LVISMFIVFLSNFSPVNSSNDDNLSNPIEEFGSSNVLELFPAFQTEPGQSILADLAHASCERQGNMLQTGEGALREHQFISSHTPATRHAYLSNDQYNIFKLRWPTISSTAHPQGGTPFRMKTIQYSSDTCIIGSFKIVWVASRC